MKTKFMNWLVADNRFMSRLLACDVCNLSVLGATVSVMLFSGAFMLANSPVEQESRLVQALMMIFAAFAALPIFIDVYHDQPN